MIVGAGPSGLASAVYARIRGSRRAGARVHRARRPGGVELTHRELSRAFRPASPARSWRRARIRRRRSSGPSSSSRRMRAASPAIAGRMRIEMEERTARARARGHHRDRRGVSQGGARQSATVRGRWRVLRRHVPRSAALRGRGGRDRRRWQRCRSGGRIPGANGASGLHAGPIGRPDRDDVPLPDPAHRGQSGHRAAHEHRGVAPRGRRSPRAHRVGEQADRRHRRRAQSGICSS